MNNQEKVTHFLKRLQGMNSIVELSIGRTRCSGVTNWEEIGIDASNKEFMNALAETADPGKDYFFSKESVKKFNALEGRIRYQFAQLATEYKGIGKVMTLDSWNIWFNEKFPKLQQEYFDTRDQYYENFEQIKSQVEAAYRERLNEAWQRGVISQDSIDSRIRKTMARLPDKESYKNSFYCVCNYWPMPSMDIFYVGEYETEAQKKVIDDMNAKKQEMYEATITEVMKDFGTQIYGLINDTLLEINEQIAKTGGDLKGQTRNKLVNLLKSVENLNFMNDGVIAGQVAKIKEDMADAGIMGVEDLKVTLKKTQAEAAKALEIIKGNTTKTSASLIELF